jgi:hypothetical protein
MTTENGQRVKRKYTVTDKVLAANRLNLERARRRQEDPLSRHAQAPGG